MSAADAILCEWTGEAFLPAGNMWGRRADKLLVVGECYLIEAREPRSAESHRHYFACINEAWSNLPDSLAEQFPTADHLRKFALVKAGYRDERTFVCGSKAEAVRLAAFIKPIDDFAVVVVVEATVSVYTAKSQKMRAMGRAEFQASKDKVLDVIAAMIGTTVEAISASAGQTA